MSVLVSLAKSDKEPDTKDIDSRIPQPRSSPSVSGALSPSFAIGGVALILLKRLL